MISINQLIIKRAHSKPIFPIISATIVSYFQSHKTKDLKTLLAAHGLANKSVLIVEGTHTIHSIHDYCVELHIPDIFKLVKKGCLSYDLC